jgi:hypothetical protein
MPFLISDVHNHHILKQNVLHNIDSMGRFSFVDKNQHISHTDWHLSSNITRGYFKTLESLFYDVCKDTKEYFEFPLDLRPKNFWFQWYEKGDFHNWHIHEDTLFSNVYFLSLPNGASKTSFKLRDQEFTVDVKEGQVLTFPASYMHCSKPNQSDEPKVVVVFNT